jgi:hypothetical protein
MEHLWQEKELSGIANPEQSQADFPEQMEHLWQEKELSEKGKEGCWGMGEPHGRPSIRHWPHGKKNRPV